MLSLLNWLVNSERLLENPLRRVPKFKEFGQKRPRRACTDEEADRILAVASPDSSPESVVSRQTESQSVASAAPVSTHKVIQPESLNRLLSQLVAIL